MAIFAASAAIDRRGVRLRRGIAGGEDSDHHDDGEGCQPGEDECRPFPHPVLGLQDQDERSEGDGLEGDGQADHEEVQVHRR